MRSAATAPQAATSKATTSSTPRLASSGSRPPRHRVPNPDTATPDTANQDVKNKKLLLGILERRVCGVVGLWVCVGGMSSTGRFSCRGRRAWRGAGRRCVAGPAARHGACGRSARACRCLFIVVSSHPACWAVDSHYKRTTIRDPLERVALATPPDSTGAATATPPPLYRGYLAKTAGEGMPASWSRTGTGTSPDPAPSNSPTSSPM
jgi:hypothetical protein